MSKGFPLDRPLRLGTRASPLAIAQVELVKAALLSAHGWADGDIEILPVTASGDRILDRPLADIGGKALWTKELDQWLAAGEIDASVHSMKDVETIRPDMFVIAAMLPRADVRDVLIGAASIADIPWGGRLGTSSPRRSAQIRRLRPDLSISLFRGNVATRLGRLQAGEADATLLARAGLVRLNRTDIGVPVPVDQMLPAPAQGAIGVEALTANAAVRELLSAIDDGVTSDCVRAERAVLLALGGSCHSPIAALATRAGDSIRLRAEILSPDGSEVHGEDRLIGRTDLRAAEELGSDLLAGASPALRRLFAP
ncbi:MAG: hydroxymethylbilane synthase [Sphingobium sp.]